MEIRVEVPRFLLPRCVLAVLSELAGRPRSTPAERLLPHRTRPTTVAGLELERAPGRRPPALAIARGPLGRPPAGMKVAQVVQVVQVVRIVEIVLVVRVVGIVGVVA